MAAFSLSSYSSTVLASGGSYTIDVTDSCGAVWPNILPWFHSNAAWITITAPQQCTTSEPIICTPNGYGSGPLTYNVAPNTGPARTGTMTISGQTFIVDQEEGLTLTVTKLGTGTGTVTSYPSGIDCDPAGTDCSESYDLGTSVTLTAAAGGSSVFTGWNGCDTPAGQNCYLYMDGAKNVTADFSATLDLGEAVDNTSLTWSTGGNANWVGQSSLYFFGTMPLRADL